MSGICAIIARTSAPVEPLWLRRMVQAMAHRGPDGQQLVLTQGAAFGHCLLGTEATGRLVWDATILASADCRLDNRDELTQVLRLPPGAGDTEILIAGYRRWGEALAPHLLGDFAFIIWDSAARRLYAARDHFGVKPFYYACARQFFAGGSDISAIFASGLAGPELHEPAIAEFLSGLPPAEDATSFAHVRRLPPGHFGVLSGGELRIERYWSLPRPAIIRRQAAPEEFRHLLSLAVRARLRGGRAGAMLSGGLDSSSIAALAREPQAPLKTFSMVFDATPALNERPFIEAVLAKGGFAPNFLPSDDVPPFAELATLLDEQQDLFLAPNLACSRRLHHAAHAAGLRILLDGHGGDEVAPVGTGRLFELAAAGEWATLWRQLGPGVLAPGEKKLAAYWWLLGSFSTLRQLRRFRLARRLLWPAVTDPSASFLNPGFAKRCGLTRRRRPKPATAEAHLHYEAVTGPRQSYAFEILDRTAAFAQVEARYPFWDRRLVEFCLSLPPEEKLDKGWGRLILRRAMEGVLPTEVQWRAGKFDFAPHLASAMVRNHDGLINEVLADRTGILACYLDLRKLAAAYRVLRENPGKPDGYVVQCISRVVILAAWLRRRQEAVPGPDPAPALLHAGSA